MWEHCVTASRRTPCKLDREVDWVIKHHLIEAYREKHDLPSPTPASPCSTCSTTTSTAAAASSTSCRRGAWSSGSHRRRHRRAVETPPQTTRARLRGEFIRKAKERKRDYTVDWVHLKLNDQAQRTVLCKDPFKCRDERVERLIASSRRRPVPSYRTGAVTGVLGERQGLQRVDTTEGRAYALTGSWARWRSATRSCSTPPPSSWGSAPAAGTSCTGTWRRGRGGPGAATS